MRSPWSIRHHPVVDGLCDSALDRLQSADRKAARSEGKPVGSASYQRIDALCGDHVATRKAGLDGCQVVRMQTGLGY